MARHVSPDFLLLNIAGTIEDPTCESLLCPDLKRSFQGTKAGHLVNP